MCLWAASGWCLSNAWEGAGFLGQSPRTGPGAYAGIPAKAALQLYGSDSGAGGECNIVAECAGNRLQNLVSEPDCRLRELTVCQENISEAFIWKRVYIIGRWNALPSCSNTHFIEQTHAHTMLVNRWHTGVRPGCGSVLAADHSRGELLILRWKDCSGGDFPAASQENKCGFIKENESQLQMKLLYSIVSWYLLLRMIFLMKSSGGFAMMAVGLCGTFHRFGSSDFPGVTPCTAFRGKMGTRLWIVTEVFAKLEIHSSLFFFSDKAAKQLFHIPFVFHISSDTVSHPPLSILSSFLFMMLLFQLQGSKNIFFKPNT